MSEPPELHPHPDDRAFLRRVFILLIVAVLAAVLVLVHNLLLLAFGSLLIALVLIAASEFFQHRLHLSKSPALALAALLLLGALGLIGYLFYAELAFQAEMLGRELPLAWQAMERRLAQGPIGRLLLNSLQNRATVTWLTNEAGAIARGSAVVLFNLVIVISAAIYFAADPARYRRGLAMLSPPRYRALTDRTLGEIGMALRLWLVTQGISMVVMGALFALGLYLSGVPAWGALAVLGGLAEFIPYVGPIVAMVPAFLLAAAGQGSLAGVFLTYALARIIQMNVVTPLVTGRVVSVPPGLYIFLILGAGYLFGTFGLFFSGPLAIAAYSGWLALYSRATLGDAVETPSEHAAARKARGEGGQVSADPPKPPAPDRR
ncbi:MAG TPA: AI-2E family transporter [Qipengyuania sp.]|nr:AI-2E family transporter [Qipengyuania sp.]